MAKILIADEESYIRFYFSHELADEGHKVKAVKGGRNLLSVINDFNPDVLVLDIRFAGHNGLDLLLDIRISKRELPIILCTAYDDFKYDLRSMAADYYVVKSCDLSDLKRKIKMALETQSSFKIHTLPNGNAGGGLQRGAD